MIIVKAKSNFGIISSQKNMILLPVERERKKGKSDFKTLCHSQINNCQKTNKTKQEEKKKKRTDNTNFKIIDFSIDHSSSHDNDDDDGLLVVGGPGHGKSGLLSVFLKWYHEVIRVQALVKNALSESMAARDVSQQKPSGLVTKLAVTNLHTLPTESLILPRSTK